MTVYKRTGYVIQERNAVYKSLFPIVPPSISSMKWKIWRTMISMNTCAYCLSLNGRILSIEEAFGFEMDLPVHQNCNCYIEFLKAITAGTATYDGMDGVDWFVKTFGYLPDNYLTQKEAKSKGWIKILGNLAEVLPSMVIGGDIYKNYDKRLPSALGRIWYEADFNYDGGYRGNERLLFSNDGLIFATYDHYLTFYEIN